MRLGVVGALCFCVLIVLLISRRLYGSRPISWLCALFQCLRFTWFPLQLRLGRFLSAWIFSFEYLCVPAHEWASAGDRFRNLLGIAFLVKQTFLAVPIAIISWLIYRRRYKEAVVWATGFASTVVGGYGIAWWREPLILKHIAALDSPLLEFRFAPVIILTAVSHAVVPFAAVGGFSILWQRAPEKLLVVIYCVVAWFVAMLTIAQAGGSINYFWEPLFASAVLAGPGFTNFSARRMTLPYTSEQCSLYSFCGLLCRCCTGSSIIFGKFIR